LQHRRRMKMRPHPQQAVVAVVEADAAEETPVQLQQQRPRALPQLRVE
jgi:hypothetical protein